MRLRWISIAALAILVLPFGTSFARQPATYKVAATLQHSGSVFASPALTIQAGVAGRVEVAGPGGYILELTIVDADQGALKVDADLDSAYGSIAPTFVVRLNEPAKVAVGDLALEVTVSQGGG
jgi:hypothetical protein